MSNIEGDPTKLATTEFTESPDLFKEDIRIDILETGDAIVKDAGVQADRNTPGRNNVYVTNQPPPNYHAREAPPAYEDSSFNSSANRPRNRQILIIDDDDPIYPGNSWMFEDPPLRRSFIRKVMAIVGCQFAIVFAFIAFAMFHEPTKRFMMRTWWLAIVALVIFFITLIILSCVPSSRRKVPCNYILLLVYTVSLSYICAAGSTRYSTNAILIAMGGTMGICLLVGLLACQPWLDITKWTPILWIAAIVFMVFGLIFGILYAVTGNPIFDIIYAGLGVTFFTVMLLYDLQMILGGKKYEMSPEEYIYGALTLFSDIIMIFMNLLTLVGRCN